jgi:hypothetical protein
MNLRLTKLALAIPLILAAAPTLAVELTGSIRSSTGTLPPGLKVQAQGQTFGSERAGKVEGGRYRIVLPDSGRFRVLLQAEGWDAAPKLIWDPKTAGALDILVYPEAVPEQALAAELIEMGRQDQAIRRGHNPDKPDPAYVKRMQQEDHAREQRLAAIVDAKGWPLVSMVGYEAAGSAWTVAQHGSPAFLKRCLPLMQAAGDKLEINPQHLALSIDRVRVESGKPQVYGSQLHEGKGGRMEPDRIEDREHVDARRAAMGMEPLADYLARFGQ